MGLWWVVVPSIFLGLIVGGIPGFSAANTIIVLLPFTFLMEVEVGLVFMIALYCASRLGAGIPAILVNIPGTAGAAATPLDGYQPFGWIRPALASCFRFVIFQS